MTETRRSFARTPKEREDRQQAARTLLGLTLIRVRYVDIDYRRVDLAPDHRGPRAIVDETEWEDPTWRYDGFDSVDHGVELETADHRLVTVTWDPPGQTEGISIWEGPLVGSAVTDDADVAIWDVSERSGWSVFRGKPIEDIALHYAQWEGPAGFWCPRITVGIGGRQVQLLLGEARAPAFTLGPSADNIAVLFPPHVLPEWAEVVGDARHDTTPQ